MLMPPETRPTPIIQFKTGQARRHLWAADEPILYFTYGTSSQDVVMITGIR
jgi:hypothetical protein